MSDILLERSDNGIVTLTLNRPAQKNALNAAMWNELLRIFRDVAARETDRVLVITGAGGAFCAGADLNDTEAADRHVLDGMDVLSDIALALHRLPKPSIAKVDGVAAGAGANLALGCDLVYASANARFCQIFARRGLAVDFGGSWLLPRLVGLRRAKELALLAPMIGAERALEIGLINAVAPEGGLEAMVDEAAGTLAAGPPIALRLSKRLLDRSLESTFAEAVDAEGVAQAVTLVSEDAKEAIAAFLEKRAPRFSGH